MTFWFNASSSENGYSSASCTKWNEVNSRIVFSEFGIKEDDNFFYLFGFCTEFTNLKNFKDNSWSFEPHKLTVKLAKKDYTRTYQGDTKEIKQSSVEKFAVDTLTNWDKTKLYTGTVYLQQLQQYDWYVAGTLDPAMKSAFIAGMFHTSILTTEPQKIKLEEFTPAASSGGGGSRGSGYKGQTEIEKLGDRMTFLFSFYRSAFPEEKIESIADLLKLEERPEFWLVTGFFNEVFGSSVVKR